MAAVTLDPASGRYRIRFYYGGVQYHRSIKTKDENKARRILLRVEETIQFLEQGRIVMPPDADPFTFILSDGKLTEKESVKAVRTLADLFTAYEEQFTEGAKEANTRRTEKIHAAHLQRLIGVTATLGSIKTGTLQEYVNAALQGVVAEAADPPPDGQERTGYPADHLGLGAPHGLYLRGSPRRGNRVSAPEREAAVPDLGRDRGVCQPRGAFQARETGTLGRPLPEERRDRRTPGVRSHQRQAALALRFVRVRRPYRGAQE